MVIPIVVCTPTGCEESSHPVQGAVFMGFVVPVVRAEKRARTTGYCPFTPPACQKRPDSSPLLEKEGCLRHQKNAAKPPQKAQAGWSLTRAVACERLLFLASPYRARIRSAHARPLRSKVASRHLLEVASTPPFQRLLQNGWKRRLPPVAAVY